jgi:hypothetical protein
MLKIKVVCYFRNEPEEKEIVRIDNKCLNSEKKFY